MGKVLKNIKKFFSELDFFSASATLRQTTPCLGLISLCLLAFFMYLLITNLINIISIDGDALKVTESFESDNEVKNITNMMFAVSIAIKNVAFDQVKNYFTVHAIVSGKQITLAPCRAQQWSLIGAEYNKSFYDYRLYQSYCPSQMLNIQVNNSFEVFLSIYFDQCDIAINPNCLTDQKFNQFMLNYYATQNVIFPFWLNFLTPVADVNAPEPIKYFVQYKRLSISKTQSAVANIKFDKFKVRTDTSFWPVVQKISEVSGFAPGQLSITNIPKNTSQHLLVINSYLSQNVALYVRKIRKIDDLLSYLGGLLGLIVLLVAFLVNGYNVYRYELKVAESTFNYNNEGLKMREKDLNAWVYIKYIIFLFLNMVTFNRIKWKDCLAMQETLTQSRELLNVQKFFNRLQFLQDFIWTFVSEDELKIMSLVQPQSIDQIRKKRYCLEYFKAITNLQRSPTVQQVIQSSNTSVESHIKALLEIHAVKSSKWKKKKPQFQIDIQHEETVDEIIQSLMNDLNINNEIFCQKIACHKSLATQAKHLHLENHLVAVQKQMVKSFLDLSVLPQQVIENIIKKMPIIILHRLRFRAMEINKDKINKIKKKRTLPNRPSALVDLFQSLGISSVEKQQQKKE